MTCNVQVFKTKYKFGSFERFVRQNNNRANFSANFQLDNEVNRWESGDLPATFEFSNDVTGLGYVIGTRLTSQWPWFCNCIGVACSAWSHRVSGSMALTRWLLALVFPPSCLAGSLKFLDIDLLFFCCFCENIVCWGQNGVERVIKGYFFQIKRGCMLPPWFL